MLAVITDDFTGAAEIAGVAFAHGFSVTIQTETVSPVKTDVLVVATGMRSMPVAAAVSLSKELSQALKALQPAFIYKKVDSVLRGHVGPEISAQMAVENKQRALVVPANPSLGRTVEGGTYFVAGQPLATTSFGEALQACGAGSDVVKILEFRGSQAVRSASPSDNISEPGIIAGNAKSEEDMKAWAAQVDESTSPAGGVDFFRAILETNSLVGTGRAPDIEPARRSKRLYICGSSFPGSRQAVAEAAAAGTAVISVPDALYYNCHADSIIFGQWADDVAALLDGKDTVIVSAPQDPGPGSIDGAGLGDLLSKMVALVNKQVPLGELMIEGGATSERILKALGVDTLIPVEALATGVTRMRAEGRCGLYITTKPGSYSWPEAIWNFDKGLQG